MGRITALIKKDSSVLISINNWITRSKHPFVIWVLHVSLYCYFDVAQCYFATFVWPRVEAQRIEGNIKLWWCSNKHWWHFCASQVWEIKLYHSGFLKSKKITCLMLTKCYIVGLKQPILWLLTYQRTHRWGVFWKFSDAQSL